MSWNLADLFEAVCDAVADREALVCDGRRLTFRELDERTTRLANHLAAQGVGEGDKVGVYAYNGPEFVEAWFAAYKLRAVPINVNYRYVEDELRYLFDNADLVALVHGAAVRPAHRARARGLPEAEDVRVDRRRQRPKTSRRSARSTTTRRSPRHRRRVTSRRARTTTSTSSTPAARPACPRA